jgi:predicted ATPase
VAQRLDNAQLGGTVLGEFHSDLFKVGVGTAHHDAAGTVGRVHPTGEEEAGACFLQAVEVARRQRAKSCELRAATSLARLWQQQGKRKEARRMPTEIYNWSTEGFDTKDLRDAGALLKELA